MAAESSAGVVMGRRFLAGGGAEPTGASAAVVSEASLGVLRGGLPWECLVLAEEVLAREEEAVGWRMWTASGRGHGGGAWRRAWRASPSPSSIPRRRRRREEREERSGGESEWEWEYDCEVLVGLWDEVGLYPA
jgi:hypothetical protein